MKRYSSVVICVVLLVCTLFLLPSTAKNEVTVGKGNGKNEKINTVEDLIGMLYCIQRGDYDATLSVNTKALETEESKEVIASLLAFSMGSNDSEEKSAGDTQRLVAQSDKDDEDEEEITAYNFDSFTVHEYGHISMDSGESSIDNMNRELSIYVDGTKSYYRSIGQISSEYEITDEDGHNETATSLADFDMEFYMDAKREKVYMKINYFYNVAEEPVTFSSEIIGRWVYIESEMFNNIFLSINQYNLSYLSDLSSAISEAYERGDLKNKTKNQSLDKEKMGDYYEELYDRFDIKIDISDPESPTISMLSSLSIDGGYDPVTSSYKESYNINVDALYTFENINNTEVSMRSGVDIFEIEEDDIEDYIYSD